MALSSTIFKADLNISDMDRNYYAEHQLTLARHPSETDERMMVRLLAFALHADERLTFTKGLCVDEEPALWLKNYTGEIDLWIDVGLPDEKRLRKACSLAKQVVLYTYGGNTAELWWKKNQSRLGRFGNLSVTEVTQGDCETLVSLVQRSMKLQCTIQDRELWFNSEEVSYAITPISHKENNV